MANFTGTVDDDTLTGGVGNDLLEGLGGNDHLLGDGGDDTLYGQAGNDLLDGGPGADVMRGGAGDDVYNVDHPGDQVIEWGDSVTGGVDTVMAAITYTLTGSVENLNLTGTAPLAGNGNTLANTINGNVSTNVLSGGHGDDLLFGHDGGDTLNGGDGNDTLNGGAGPDHMKGGAGDDVYDVGDVGDQVVEWGDSVTGGVDRVNAMLSFTLSGQVENLSLMGFTPINGTGNVLANEIIGNAAANILTGNGGDDSLMGNDGHDTLMGGTGHDVLSGGLGEDSMVGGTGNDLYEVDDALDVVVESGDSVTGGVDAVNAWIDYILPTRVENLFQMGTASLVGTGNSLANVLHGNDAASTLNGAAGNDTLYGHGAGDAMQGGAGDDVLIGGADGDWMGGGVGNDVYEVDDIWDIVFEWGDISTGGHDTVNSFVTYTLGSSVEDLTLIGMSALTGTGNELANVINGSEAVNTLYGLLGDDTLNGFNGGDTLLAGPGNDVLHGGMGDDLLQGGVGTDLYRFLLSDGMDIVYENNGSELDRIRFDDPAIGVDRLWFMRVGNYLQIDVLDGGTTVIVDNYFTITSHGWRIELHDGSHIDRSRIDELFGHMESLPTPSGSLIPADGVYTDLHASLPGIWIPSGRETENVIHGTPGVDTLNGTEGNDALIGHGGADYFFGGMGNDRIVVPDAAFSQIDGSMGGDTLQLWGSGIVLDLTAFPTSTIQGIEQIDIVGNGSNSLVLAASDVLDLSFETDTVKVMGNADDSVTMTDTGWSMTESAALAEGGHVFDRWQNGTAELLIEQGITIA